ncbi:hypothetical protein [uncultured Chryseobacterium sp.]|uniref:hypothetical protein n=1 Tax=uncultured Chryseobacterium sp. TaxID=259322 RepID=UPI0025CF2203|nr:hypothetical protein [uncultured Chryseobacterium sp.]
MTGDLAPRLILKNTQPNIREKEILKALIGNLHYYEYSLSRMKVFFCFHISDGRVYSRIGYASPQTRTVFSRVKEIRAASSKPPGKTQMMKKNIVQA